MIYKSVKDSGTRQSFDTGSVRDTREGKGRFDLLPPVVLMRLAQHFENGAAKYGDRNWEKGQPVSRFYDSAMRHMVRWWEGQRDEDHLAAAMWNVAGMIHTLEMVERGRLPASLTDQPDDMPAPDKRGRPCIYIAGPMRGYKDYNFPAFDAAQATLEAEGWEVVNPAQMDRDAGYDCDFEVTPEFLRDAFARDLPALCRCGAIYMLAGWALSDGAAIEHDLAKALGLTVLYEGDECNIRSS